MKKHTSFQQSPKREWRTGGRSYGGWTRIDQ